MTYKQHVQKARWKCVTHTSIMSLPLIVVLVLILGEHYKVFPRNMPVCLFDDQQKNQTAVVITSETARHSGEKFNNVPTNQNLTTPFKSSTTSNGQQEKVAVADLPAISSAQKPAVAVPLQQTDTTTTKTSSWFLDWNGSTVVTFWWIVGCILGYSVTDNILAMRPLDKWRITVTQKETQLLQNTGWRVLGFDKWTRRKLIDSIENSKKLKKSNYQLVVLRPLLGVSLPEHPWCFHREFLYRCQMQSHGKKSRFISLIILPFSKVAQLENVNWSRLPAVQQKVRQFAWRHGYKIHVDFVHSDENRLLAFLNAWFKEKLNKLPKNQPTEIEKREHSKFPLFVPAMKQLAIAATKKTERKTEMLGPNNQNQNNNSEGAVEKKNDGYIRFVSKYLWHPDLVATNFLVRF